MLIGGDHPNKWGRCSVLGAAVKLQQYFASELTNPVLQKIKNCSRLPFLQTALSGGEVGQDRWGRGGMGKIGMGIGEEGGVWNPRSFNY